MNIRKHHIGGMTGTMGPAAATFRTRTLCVRRSCIRSRIPRSHFRSRTFPAEDSITCRSTMTTVTTTTMVTMATTTEASARVGTCE